MRATFIVKFFFYNDLRSETQIRALSSVNALVLALEQAAIDEWCKEEGFRIEIKLKE